MLSNYSFLTPLGYRLARLAILLSTSPAVRKPKSYYVSLSWGRPCPRPITIEAGWGWEPAEKKIG